LVTIDGGADSAAGGAGDSTNVSQTFQPSGLLSWSNFHVHVSLHARDGKNISDLRTLSPAQVNRYAASLVDRDRYGSGIPLTPLRFAAGVTCGSQ